MVEVSNKQSDIFLCQSRIHFKLTLGEHTTLELFYREKDFLHTRTLNFHNRIRGPHARVELRYKYSFQNCNGHFRKCMLSSISKRQFYKNEYVKYVYHCFLFYFY